MCIGFKRHHGRVTLKTIEDFNPKNNEYNQNKIRKVSHKNRGELN